MKLKAKILFLVCISFLVSCTNPKDGPSKGSDPINNEFEIAISNETVDLEQPVEEIQLGETSPTIKEVSKSLTIKNTNTTSINLAISLTNDPGFKIKLNRCPAVLLPKASCSITVSFSNRGLYSNTYSSVLNLTESKSILLKSSIIEIPNPLTGGIAKLSAVLSSGFVPRTAVLYRTLTLKNIGTGNVSSISFTVPSGYSVRLNRCPIMLSPGKTCTVEIAQKDFRSGTVAADQFMTVTSANESISIVLVSGQVSSGVEEFNDKLPSIQITKLADNLFYETNSFGLIGLHEQDAYALTDSVSTPGIYKFKTNQLNNYSLVSEGTLYKQPLQTFQANRILKGPNGEIVFTIDGSSGFGVISAATSQVTVFNQDYGIDGYQNILGNYLYFHSIYDGYVKRINLSTGIMSTVSSDVINPPPVQTNNKIFFIQGGVLKSVDINGQETDIDSEIDSQLFTFNEELFYMIKNASGTYKLVRYAVNGEKTVYEKEIRSVYTERFKLIKKSENVYIGNGLDFSLEGIEPFTISNNQINVIDVNTNPKASNTVFCVKTGGFPFNNSQVYSSLATQCVGGNRVLARCAHPSGEEWGSYEVSMLRQAGNIGNFSSSTPIFSNMCNNLGGIRTTITVNQINYIGTDSSDHQGIMNASGGAIYYKGGIEFVKYNIDSSSFTELNLPLQQINQIQVVNQRFVFWNSFMGENENMTEILYSMNTDGSINNVFGIGVDEVTSSSEVSKSGNEYIFETLNIVTEKRSLYLFRP